MVLAVVLKRRDSASALDLVVGPCRLDFCEGEETVLQNKYLSFMQLTPLKSPHDG